jgi:Secretion system C-terminal sorting domain
VAYTGTTLNNQTFTLVFPNGLLGNFLVTMVVSHIGPDGKPCERRFTQTVHINCIVVGAAPTCNDNIIINPGFDQNSMPGILGQTGKTNAWARSAGRPTLVDDAGFADRYSIVLTGKCFGVVDVISHAIVLGPKRLGRVNIAYKASAEDLRPGTYLVLRLSDNAQTDLACKDACVEIARMPINATDGKWGNISTTFSLNGLEGRKILSLHLENDLVYEDADANSKVSIDNLCFEQLESLTTGTRDLLNNRLPIRIFPNPNLGKFTVELPKPATTGMSLRVTDLAGRLVLEQSTETGILQQTIQAEYLSNGMYFLQLVEKGRVVGVEKFVKQ